MDIKRFLATALLMLHIGQLHANAEKSPHAEDQVTEMYVLSIQFESGHRASLVVRPCGKNEECKKAFVRVDSNTLFKNGGEDISFEAAKSLNWEHVAISMDKFNVATEIDRLDFDALDEN